jgi:hypothetical protein
MVVMIMRCAVAAPGISSGGRKSALPDRENTAEQENTAESEENKMSRMQSVIVDTICSAYAKTIATILALISLKFVEASGRKTNGRSYSSATSSPVRCHHHSNNSCPKPKPPVPSAQWYQCCSMPWDRFGRRGVEGVVALVDTRADNGCNEVAGAKMAGAKMAGAKTASPTI